MAIHELKTWSEYFYPISNGKKQFEIRINDRDYKVGDILDLKEYNPNNDLYSGREIRVYVTYVFKLVSKGKWGDTIIQRLVFKVPYRIYFEYFFPVPMFSVKIMVEFPIEISNDTASYPKAEAQ